MERYKRYKRMERIRSLSFCLTTLTMVITISFFFGYFYVSSKSYTPEALKINLYKCEIHRPKSAGLNLNASRSVAYHRNHSSSVR